MDTKMTIAERQAFLAETRVGIISIPEEGRGPLTVPVWYSYQPGGEVHVWTHKSSRKCKLLNITHRVSFCVQEPVPPFYKYVSVEGPFTIQPIDLEQDVHPMALRYYGLENGEQYYRSLDKTDLQENSILVCITPERWFSADYSKTEADH